MYLFSPLIGGKYYFYSRFFTKKIIAMLTDLEKEYVNENYKKQTTREMGRQLKISYSAIQWYMVKNNLYSAHSRATRQLTEVPPPLDGDFTWEYFKTTDFIFNVS